jgi:uncharacterized membrane protein YbjE (DUF340 family)
MKLGLSLTGGALVAIYLGKQRWHRFTAISLDLVLYSLLFFMGVNTAQIPHIEQQIVQIGYDAMISTALVIAGCIISSVLLGMIVRKHTSGSVHVRQEISWKRLKTPLIMIGIVVLGGIVAITTSLFSWFSSSVITVVLYVLLFFVGMQMVQHEVNLRPLLTSPLMLLLPISTVIGTYIGALAIPLVTRYTIREALTLVSGFGWYSLSGVLISGLGDPQLGSVSFLSNLFRESASFILIPLLATFSRVSFSAVSIAGATSMDVTLPLLKKSLGDTAVPLAITHGVIISLISPFLIPLWYG